MTDRELAPSFIPIPVGPHLFSLRMVCGPLFNEDGAQCMARLDMSAGEILVSREVPPEHRAAVGAATAARAWQTLLTSVAPVNEIAA